MTNEHRRCKKVKNGYGEEYCGHVTWTDAVWSTVMRSAVTVIWYTETNHVVTGDGNKLN